MITKSLRTLALLLVAIVAACSGTTASPIPTLLPSPITSLAASLPPVSAPPPSLNPTQPPATAAPPTTAPTATPLPSLPAGPLADALGQQLDQTLTDQLNLYSIPGMNAAVIFPDSSRWGGADGLSEPDRAVEATPETTFVVGSITKTFVTAAMMELQQEGVLSIDDPLSDWIPDYPNGENITLRMLLGHTSGLYDYFNHPEYNLRVFNEPHHVWTPQEVLDDFVLDPYFPPGEGYKYSNTNFLLAGMVIEAATGNPLGEELRTRFLEPLELDDTNVQSAGPPPPGSAQGCLQRANGPQCLDDGTDYRPTTSAATVAFGAGDIVSTSDDLADWVSSLYGGQVLEPDSLAEMTDWHQYTREAYGLGTRTRLIDGHRAFGHTGSLRGFDAAMWYIPDLDTSIVVLTNRGRVDANPMIDALAGVALPYAEAYTSR